MRTGLEINGRLRKEWRAGWHARDSEMRSRRPGRGVSRAWDLILTARERKTKMPKNFKP